MIEVDKKYYRIVYCGVDYAVITSVYDIYVDFTLHYYHSGNIYRTSWMSANFLDKWHPCTELTEALL